jgi:transposase
MDEKLWEDLEQQWYDLFKAGKMEMMFSTWMYYRGCAAQSEADAGKVERMVECIKRDFTDRCGLRQEWEEIDPGTQAEILFAWKGIIKKALTAAQIKESK